MITDDSIVPVFPLPEQHRTVAEIEQRLSIVAATQQALTANLDRAGCLRQSILQQGFTSQLAPQEKATAHAS